jgi:hypothetical protein
MKLTMANIDDDKTEELLSFVRCIARMTEHDKKTYDDTESELAAFDTLIRNARQLLKI